MGVIYARGAARTYAGGRDGHQCLGPTNNKSRTRPYISGRFQMAGEHKITPQSSTTPTLGRFICITCNIATSKEPTPWGRLFHYDFLLCCACCLRLSADDGRLCGLIPAYGHFEGFRQEAHRREHAVADHDWGDVTDLADEISHDDLTPRYEGHG